MNEFMGTMGVFSAALGVSCEDFHAAGEAPLLEALNDSVDGELA